MNTNKHRFVRLLLPIAFLLFTCVSLAQNGKDAQWATAGKQGVGTSASLNSKVWFTLAQGVMTEVYYPDVTVANVHLLQFVVVNPKTKKIETEQDDAIHELITEDEYNGGTPVSDFDAVELRAAGVNIPVIKKVKPEDRLVSANSLEFIQQNKAKSGKWTIKKRYITDTENNSVLIRVFFSSIDKNLELYVYYDPSLGNGGMQDNAWNQGNVMIAQDNDKCSALVVGDGRNSESIEGISNGFYQISDGLEQLKGEGRLVIKNQKTENGNVAQIAKIGSKKKGQAIFTLSLGFGDSPQSAFNSANSSLIKGFDNSHDRFVRDWNNYVKTIPKVDPKYQAQFNMAAMILKAHEDKTIRGANIASLTVPWGGGANANENNIGGYHLIWSRDLYQVATAFMALGDKESAIRALDFLFKVQQKPDGSFPQNSFLDGKPFWGSLQLDEVAFPLILAHELGKTDKETYEKHVKLAADFIVKNGPVTPQERWEEEGGYSPSTIAAEIAGLVCAADIANKNSDTESASRWLKTADEWQANIEKWTVTKTGKYSKEPYYLRITQGKPDSGEKLELNNGAGFFDERDIVDAGFLELVRLGIKPADDKIIQNSLKVIDQVIRVKTPNGDGFYRYNHDGYGEMDDGRRWNWDGKYTGKGRLWALLSGERGQYEIALHSFLNPNKKATLTRDFYSIKDSNSLKIEGLPERSGEYLVDLNMAKMRLDAMLAFANEGLMIPEQIWDKAETPKSIDKQFVPELKFGEGTGSATPLAWSMAQFIRLAVNLKEGRNLDTPKVVYDRYVLGKKSNIANTDFDEKPLSFQIGQKDIAKFFEKLKDPCENAKSHLTDLGMFGSQDVGKKNPVIFSQPNNAASPLIFTYSGTAKNVEIVGDFTSWKSCGMSFVDSNGLKVFILSFPNSARVEYKLIVDGKWIIDPQNPNKVDNGVGGENSFFTMPDYKETEWSKTKFGLYLSNKHIIKSKTYGEKEIQVYVPEGFEKQLLPVLYVQDGSDYQKRTNALTIQRNLVNANKIKPFIIVFLDPKDRMKEYMANDDYAKFLAEEVVPAIDAKYKTIKSRDGRAVLGASLGGITAVNVGLKYPKIFGRIGGQSVSWWVDNERIVKDLEKLDGKTKFKFYIDDGTLEGVEDSRKAVAILKKKGFDVTYVEGETGHNWTAWRDRLAGAFIAIWK